jgi:hypothetical protein
MQQQTAKFSTSENNLNLPNLRKEKRSNVQGAGFRLQVHRQQLMMSAR